MWVQGDAWAGQIREFGGKVLRALRGAVTGVMMTKTAETPTPFWLFYFNVDGLDAAMARATQAGGKVIMGPHQVPGGSWIAHCLDPQGAIFAMVAAQR